MALVVFWGNYRLAFGGTRAKEDTDLRLRDRYLIVRATYSTDRVYPIESVSVEVVDTPK